MLQSPLFGVHVSSLLFAYASFALACVIGITYVLLFKEIKAKHLGFFYARLPSLQVLDVMNQRAIVDRLDLPDARHRRRRRSGRRRCSGSRRTIRGSQAMSLQDPKIFVALVCWAVYSFELFAARRSAGAAGARRTCRRSASSIVLLNFVPISYFLTKSHNF